MFGIFSWIKIGMVVLVVSMIGAAYWHYTSLVRERDDLRERTTIMQLELTGWKDQWEQMKAGLAEVERLRREAREYNDQITKLLAQHDLNKLAMAKPGLIEKRVNRATAARISVLECITDLRCTDTTSPASGDQSAGVKTGRVDGGDDGWTGAVLPDRPAVRELSPEQWGARAVDKGSGGSDEVVS